MLFDSEVGGIYLAGNTHLSRDESGTRNTFTEYLKKILALKPFQPAQILNA